VILADRQLPSSQLDISQQTGLRVVRPYGEMFVNPTSTGDAAPGFPVGLGGIKELHAAFLIVIHRRCRPTGDETNRGLLPG
jgi:hypothetical protein